MKCSTKFTCKSVYDLQLCEKLQNAEKSEKAIFTCTYPRDSRVQKSAIRGDPYRCFWPNLGEKSKKLGGK